MSAHRKKADTPNSTWRRLTAEAITPRTLVLRAKDGLTKGKAEAFILLVREKRELVVGYVRDYLIPTEKLCPAKEAYQRAEDFYSTHMASALRKELIGWCPGKQTFHHALLEWVHVAFMHYCNGRAIPGNPDIWNTARRRQVLAKAWVLLESDETEHPDTLHYTLLRLKEENPRAKSESLAVQVSEITGREWSAEQFRAQLSRARYQFAELLYRELETEVARDNPNDLLDLFEELHLVQFLTTPFRRDYGLPEVEGQSRDEL